MMEIKKVDIEELKKLNFEEGENLLKSLGYCNNDCVLSFVLGCFFVKSGR